MSEVTGNIRFEQKELGWKGSKMRCLLLTSMGRASLRETLMQVINQTKEYDNIKIPDVFEFYPKGIVNPNEVELDKQEIPIGGSREYCNKLYRWWLGDTKTRERTPVWDLVVTAQIDNMPGLILVEAKAHEGELVKEEKGKEEPNASSSKARKENHQKIGTAIHEARDGLRRVTDDIQISIDRDVCYQMSNRLAFAWKLASLGIPVVLIYLGFENTVEMINGGKCQLIENFKQWERTVRNHSKKVGFGHWETPIHVMNTNENREVRVYPLIRSVNIQLESASLSTKFEINLSH